MTPRASALLAALACCAACRSPAFHAFEVSADRSVRQALLADLLPREARERTVQRWVLESRGIESFFTLYLRARQPAVLEAAVLSDLGGTLAEVVLRGDEVEVRRDSRLLPAALAERLLRDVAPLFQVAAPESYELVRTADGPGLYRPGTRPCLILEDRIWVGEGARVAALLVITEWRRDAEGRPVAPRAFTVTGHAGGYRASVEVAAWERSG